MADRDLLKTNLLLRMLQKCENIHKKGKLNVKAGREHKMKTNKEDKQTMWQRTFPLWLRNLFKISTFSFCPLPRVLSQYNSQLQTPSMFLCCLKYKFLLGRKWTKWTCQVYYIICLLYVLPYLASSLKSPDSHLRDHINKNMYYWFFF